MLSSEPRSPAVAVTVMVAVIMHLDTDQHYATEVCVQACSTKTNDQQLKHILSVCATI
jgi:hypothetical protein